MRESMVVVGFGSDAELSLLYCYHVHTLGESLLLLYNTQTGQI